MLCFSMFGPLLRPSNKHQYSSEDRAEAWLEQGGDLADCLVSCLRKFEMSFSKAGEALKRRSAGSAGISG